MLDRKDNEIIKTIKVSDGICTGRNGTFDIKGISMASGQGFRFDCVSKHKGTLLNAGFSCDKIAARELAISILKEID